MQIDILTQLNDFNSQRNQQTGEYILTVPVLELEGEYIINSKKNITITSKFQTILKCQKLIITTDKSVNINNISFEAKILVYNSSNVIFSNCSISNKSGNSNGALIFYNTQSASLSHITVTNTANIPTVYIYNSNVSASNLTISKGNESLFVCKNNSTVYLKDSTLNDTHANAKYCKESHLKIENCSIYNKEFPAIFFENSAAEILNNVIQNDSQNGISLTRIYAYTHSNGNDSFPSNISFLIISINDSLISSSKSIFSKILIKLFNTLSSFSPFHGFILTRFFGFLIAESAE